MIKKVYTLLLCIFLLHPTMPLSAQETVTDSDNNTYTTVTIGNQTWMAENLKTTRYSNNDPIENVTDNATWAGLTSGAYAIYPYTSIDGLNSDAEVLEAYGALYNWYAVADNRNICPTGWHVPSDAEWFILENFVDPTIIVNSTGWRGTDGGTKLKSISDWYNNGNGTDDYGFTALPGGGRAYDDGTFYSMDLSGHWWSSTENDATYSWRRYMSYDYVNINRSFGNKSIGYSVRCLKNNLDNGLFEHHPLDGNADDIVGGNNGTAASFNPTTDRFNNVNSALYFYDTNNTVAIPSSNQFAFESNDFSISFWFTLDDITKEHNGLIGRDDFQGIAVEYNHDSDYKLYVFIDSDGADSWEFAWKPEYSSWENNKWYNLVLDRSGSNLNLYINGNLVETTTIDISVQNPTETPYYIGRSQLPNRPHLGKMDDLRFYNRSLSSSEVTDLYHEGDYYTTSDNLVAYYPFNGSTDDVSGNGNNASYSNVGYVNSRFIDGVSSSVLFDGTSQYIQVPNYASLNFNGEVTVCAWINPFVVNVEQQAICGKGGGWWRTGWLLTLNNDKVRWHLGNGNTEDEGMFDSQLSIPANEWSFIVGLWKNGVMNVYINGILDPKSELWADGLVSTTNDMYIGKTDQPDFDFFFNGYIDDVRIYNRALSANEIRELYHEGDWSTITDIDGNVYPTVKIGEQEWMAENLRTTKYNDGSDISTGYTDGDWAALTTGAYAIYPYTSIDGLNSDAEVLEAYGALYNWYAVNDSKGICPTGWKVPSDAEWYILENYVDPTIDNPDATGWRGADGGKKLKATSGWSENGYGSDDFSFTALPGGYRGETGDFYSIELVGLWWNDALYNDTRAWIRTLHYINDLIERTDMSVNVGSSVRCIKSTGASHAELPYYQTFDNDLGDCYTYSVSGDTKSWYYNESYQVAQMNGYNSGELEEDWLILPSVTLNYEEYVLNFDTWRNYGADDANNYLKLLYSTDYSGSGDPNNASWIEKAFNMPSENSVFTNSLNVDLSDIAGENVYFAFKYHYGVGMYVSWEVDNISIASDLPPQVSTLSVDDFYVTSHTAKAGGEVLTDGGGEIYSRGVIWGYDTNLTEDSHIGSAYDINTGLGSYEVILEPLTPGTTYYYRAFAINPSGWGYGDVYSFATNNAMNFCDAVDNCDLTYQHGGDFQWFGQSITTYDAIDAAQSGFVDNNQATYFTATFNNPGTISFYWKTSSQANSDFLKLYIDDVFMEEISGETDWIGAEYNMTDSPHTFKWEYIKDSEGSEGEDCGWVDHIVYVPSGFPEVTTNQVDNIMNTSATINYSVLTNGGNSITERGVVWATWENPTLASYDGITNDYDGAGTGTFNSFLTGLSENTTYFVRAYARNSAGDSYGVQLMFTTLSNNDVVTFDYYGQTVTYGIVEYNGRQWLDRNLGASRVATFRDDAESYGDYFQWGREVDGHQVSSSTTTYTLASSGSQPGHSMFILNGTEPYDWNEENSWIYRWVDEYGNDTQYDPCPAGWRVPTSEEWQDAINYGSWTNYQVPFDSELKLPTPGYRDNYNGNLIYTGEESYYWSNNPNGTTGSVLYFNYTYLGVSGANRALGGSIRCIKKEVSEDVPIVSTNSVSEVGPNSALVSATVSSEGGASVDSRGFVYSVSFENPTLDSNEGSVYEGSGTGDYSVELTGLSPSTTYYVRAYATNSYGAGYGAQLSFTTNAEGVFNKLFILNMDRATYLYDDGTGTLVAGIFDPVTDRVFISGNFSSEGDDYWPIPGSDDTFELTPDPNNESYNQLIYTISLDLNEGEFQYKYFIFNNQSDPWDYGEWEGGPNRAIYIENGNDQNDSWGIINASDMVISQDQTITISAPGLYNINSWTWDFGEGAIPAQADGYGPHDVSYSTVGSKTITLALNSGEFTYTKENFIEVGNSPTVSDVGENELGTTYAVLGCIVNPNNFETTVKLEYGETSELGNEQTLPETYLGDTNHSIEVTLDGLTENTSYFYRFVAENIFGQTASEVTELRTACTYTIYANVPSGSQNVCGGGTYTYSTSSENAETFVWEINPESAGATESTSETAQISWNHTFSGDAQVRVRGVSGTCNSEWSNYLNIYVNNTISDIEISGETEACTTSEILYKLSRAANDSYQWEVTGGNIIAQTNQVATIRWNTSGNNLLRIIEDGEGGCPISSTLEVLVNSYVAPEVPQIHRKGSINILICTTPNMDYKWFKDGSVISGQTGQYVVARNNLGYYNVQITDDNNCPNTSNPLQVDTYAMAESVLSIFPNPTSGSFTIEALGEKVGAATVRISNSFGNIIFEQKVEKNDYLYQQQLNIPNLPQGIYIVSLAVEGDMPIKAKLTIY